MSRMRVFCLRFLIACLLLLGHTSFCMTPSELQAGLNRAIAERAPSFTIPRDSYNFKTWPLVVQNAVGIVIEGSGSTLWFEPNNGLLVNSSVEVTLQNLIIDFDPPPFVQGHVSGADVSQSNALLNVTVDKGFPADLVEYVRNSSYSRNSVVLSFWDPKTRSPYPRSPWQPKGLIPEEVSTAGDGMYLMNISLGASLFDGFVPKPGDLFTVNNRMGFSLDLANSTRVLTQNVTLYGGAFSAVAEYAGAGGHVYRRVRVLRRGDRLLSANGDVFHSQGVRNGPLIEHCEVEYPQDDFFNIHTTILIAWRRPSNSELLIIDPHLWQGRDNTHYGTCATLPEVPPGSSLSFYSVGSLERVHSGAVIGSISEVTDPELVAESQKAHEELINPPYSANILNFTSHLFRVNLKSPLPDGVNPLLLVNVDDWQVTGAVIRNNRFHVTQCNLGRFKSSHGSIVGITFSNATSHNLEVLPLEPYLEGAPFIEDVLIEGNTIIGSGSQPFHTNHTFNVTIRDNTIIP